MDPHQHLVNIYLQGRKDFVAFSALPDAPILPTTPPSRAARALMWLRSTVSEARSGRTDRRFTVAPCIPPTLGRDR